MSAWVAAIDFHWVCLGESLGIDWVTSSWSPEGCPMSAWVGAKEHPGQLPGYVRGRCLGLPIGSMSREQLGIKPINQTVSRQRR